MASKHPLQFSDGNVEIHFSTTDEKYILHSHVLALHSSWFKACLSERWNAGNEATMVNGKNHWEFQLRFEKDSESAMLIRKSNITSVTTTEFVSGNPMEIAKGSSKSVKAAAKLHDSRVLAVKAHMDMLACFYHVSPRCIKSGYPESRQSLQMLAELSQAYACLAVTKLPIEIHLHENRKMVIQRCREEPLTMLELALPLESKWVFTEAASRIIGSDVSCYEQAKIRLSKLGIFDLIHRKRLRFITILKDCDLDLLKIASGTPYLMKPHHIMAASYYRHWLTIVLDRLSQGSGLYGDFAKVYRTIVDATLAIPQDTSLASGIPRFFKAMGHPCDQSDLQKIEVELKKVLGAASKALTPILGDLTEDQQTSKLSSYSLACVGVDEDELPWVKN